MENTVEGREKTGEESTSIDWFILRHKKKKVLKHSLHCFTCLYNITHSDWAFIHHVLHSSKTFSLGIHVKRHPISKEIVTAWLLSSLFHLDFFFLSTWSWFVFCGTFISCFHLVCGLKTSFIDLHLILNL